MELWLDVAAFAVVAARATLAAVAAFAASLVGAAARAAARAVGPVVQKNSALQAPTALGGSMLASQCGVPLPACRGLGFPPYRRHAVPTCSR